MVTGAQMSWRSPIVSPKNPSLGHPDNSKWVFIEKQSAAYDRRIAPQLFRPEAVADYGHRMRVRHIVIFRSQRTAQICRHSKDDSFR